MRGESNCRRVALLFRHDSNRFFFNRALNCCNTNGKPVRVVLMVSVCVCQSQVGDERRNFGMLEYITESVVFPSFSLRLCS